ncbi:PREDICTED: probable carboxylesterase 5 [Prunus mume]|uniref:Probable carboxylesterase 5 n=1 Tax=Prunus mume TaxID=102107 RepID=A0ABM0PA88_PRUMU|nr:PREDICTED: probable carboxylesterase 5 [Prunus mume]
MGTCCVLTTSLWPKPKNPTCIGNLKLNLPTSLFTPLSLPHRKSCSIRLYSSSSTSMDASLSNEVAKDFSPFLKIYKDGRVERLSGTDIVPTSLDPQTGVESKDAVISPDTGVSARLYIPKTKITTNPTKLPLLVYFHGGGFCMGSPFCAYYHSYVTSLVAETNVVAVSVDYRKAPENPLPLGFDDSWAALNWVQSHFEGQGPEEWLNSYADFESVFFAGDSAGANIAHHMALRLGHEGLVGVKLKGIALVHPYFWGSEPIEGETHVVENRARAEGIWRFACPSSSGADDPLINPGKDPKLAKLGADRVLVCVAEQDVLRQRGWYYSELLKKSEWGGAVEVVETKEEDHVFHLNNPTGENAVALLKKVASFINQDI